MRIACRTGATHDHAAQSGHNAADLKQRIIEAGREEQQWRSRRTAMEKELHDLEAASNGQQHDGPLLPRPTDTTASRRKKPPKKSLQMVALAAGAGLSRVNDSVPSGISLQFKAEASRSPSAGDAAASQRVEQGSLPSPGDAATFQPGGQESLPGPSDPSSRIIDSSAVSNSSAALAAMAIGGEPAQFADSPAAAGLAPIGGLGADAGPTPIIQAKPIFVVSDCTGENV